MNKLIEKTQYEIQAETFLNEAGIVFEHRFLFHGPHWEGEKDFRDVYDLFLTRNGKEHSPIVFRFGQSIANSGDYARRLGSAKLLPKSQLKAESIASHNDPSSDDRLLDCGFKYKAVKRKAPTAYDLLASITKYDPDTFENFCSEFGYDTDSRKAEKTYFAVQEEWNKVRKFFTTEELEKLREIN